MRNLGLNHFGQIAHDYWLKTPEIRPNIKLGEFIIMPNHMHGIIFISTLNKYDSKSDNCNSKLGECNSPLRGSSQTVGAIVRGYKSSVTKQLGIMGLHEKIWQRNYYEHIIRHDQSHQIISNYIINNPSKWENDKFCTGELLSPSSNPPKRHLA